MSNDIIEQFKLALENVGAKFYYATKADEIQKYIVELAQNSKARKIVIWKNVYPSLNLNEALKHEKIDMETLGDNYMRDYAVAKIENADIGITGVDYAIAELGTLVISSKLNQNKLCYLLPGIHIAIVRKAQLTSIEVLFKNIASLILEHSVMFVTGPSRTTDIEKTLTIGVHGPKELHVILV